MKTTQNHKDTNGSNLQAASEMGRAIYLTPSTCFKEESELVPSIQIALLLLL